MAQYQQYSTNTQAGYLISRQLSRSCLCYCPLPKLAPLYFSCYQLYSSMWTGVMLNQLFSCTILTSIYLHYICILIYNPLSRPIKPICTISSKIIINTTHIVRPSKILKTPSIWSINIQEDTLPAGGSQAKQYLLPGQQEVGHWQHQYQQYHNW